MSLITMLLGKISIYSDVDPHWKQFVLDHRDEIRAAATTRIISADKMNQIRCNLPRYLREISQEMPVIDWIVFLINAIPSNIEFDQVTKIYVPEMSVIKNFYDRYQTSKASR